MGAVVKPAFTQVRAHIGHGTGQFAGLQVMQAKGLESWAVDQAGVLCTIDPVQAAVGGGVFARIQGPGDVGCLGLCVGHQLIEQAAFAHPRGAQHQGQATRQLRLDGLQPLQGLFEAQRQHRQAHVSVRLQTDRKSTRLNSSHT